MKKHSTFEFMGKGFVVVELLGQAENLRFGTIPAENVTDNKLNKPMNGLQMNLSATAEKAINSTKLQILVGSYIEQGLEFTEAFNKAHSEIYGTSL